LRFNIRSDGSVVSHFEGSSLFQGYRGIIHGGIVAALLDAAMTHCLFHHGIQALTGDLQVRFLNPIPHDARLDMRARIVEAIPPLYKLESGLIVGKRLMARGRGKFMRTELPLKRPVNNTALRF
jgi:acyl-coenzyme A thioesterase PaaI-like protein